MKATVNYNDDAVVTSIEATNDFENSHTVRLTMNKSTAVATSIEPMEGEEKVYVDDVSRLLDYVETLPFVKTVTLEEYEDGE